MAIPLLTVVRPTKRLLADKAYDADSQRQWLEKAKIKAVIPSSATRRTPYPLDRKAYRRRNVIERLFCLASRTGGVLQQDTTGWLQTTLQPSHLSQP